MPRAGRQRSGPETPGGTAARAKAALPKGARRTTPSPETLATLGADRLIGLILDETARNPGFKKLVSAALAARQGPDAVAAIVDRRLAALEGAHGFIDWQKRRAFSADLDATVTVILNELRPLDPAAALTRLRRFLDGAEAVLERVEDSTGAVQDVYERASAGFVEIVAGLDRDAAAGVAASLVPALAADPFGPFGGLLQDLIPTLPAGAISDIDAALVKATAKVPKPAGARSEAGFHRDAVRSRLLRLRQALADRRGDVDAFIALEEAIMPERPDRAAIARRLLAADRADEALAWVRSPEAPGIRVVTRADLIAGLDPEGPARDREALEVEILDALGRRSEAQDLRWARFERDLDAPALRAFVAKLPDFEDEEALVRALDHAEGFPEPHRALAFLVAWPDLGRAARLVRANAEAWQGTQYTILVPAAEALAQDHPIAATILYRRLIDRILETGRSAAYGHAARHLLHLDDLAGRLEPGAVEPDHAAYRDALRRTHGRKHGFWSLLKT